MTGEPEALTRLGWTAALAADFAPHAARGLVPARVAVEHRSLYELLGEQGALEASLAGRVRHAAQNRKERPAVGDWVACSGTGNRRTIEALLPRRSVFVRKAAGRDHQLQIVAANVDVVFLVTSLNADLNFRRLERYLTLAWESGASPVIVLSKADLAEAADALRLEVEQVGVGVPILVTSATTGHGLDEMRSFLHPHKTGALLGSSGVGKSTLINALVGFERQETQPVRRGDDKGRHTTTRRELVLLPGGGVLIDTPGMRELQIAEAGHGLLSAFDDIDRLAAACEYRDCTHGPEPGCAVKAAIAAGTLTAERLESYHKLERELHHRTVWESKRAASEAKQKDKVANKALNKRLKDKNK